MTEELLIKDLLVNRAKAAINKQLPEPCGLNCPVVCCEPVITGSFMPKQLLSLNDNFTTATSFINKTISETVDMLTTDNRSVFTFTGLLLSEIDTENGFISDSIIEQMIISKISRDIPKEKLEGYITQIKVRFRELNLAMVTLYSCRFYDTDIKGCTIYQVRPQLCRSYSCEQLSPEKIDYSLDEMIKRLSLKKEQRELVINNNSITVEAAINNYLKEC